MEEALSKIIGLSNGIQELKSQLPDIGRSDAPVLITGETGTGKELVAKAIHELSPRVDRSFVPINCAGIPIDLLENELFGHKRGAYSQAYEQRIGLIGEADGGTLFLDEIDSLPFEVQPKLLRLLQEKEYRVLGDNKVKKADIRFVAATACNLSEYIHQHKFRSDLYYRISVFEIGIPPLRVRRADIPDLAVHFIARYCKSYGKPQLHLSKTAVDVMMNYDWPGNVRELEHAIHRAVVLSRGRRIEAVELHPGQRLNSVNNAGKLEGAYHELKQKLVDRFEIQYVTQLMARYKGNVSSAARAAGLDRRSFQRLLAKHHLRNHSGQL